MLITWTLTLKLESCGNKNALVQGYPIPGIMVVGNPLDNKGGGIGGSTLRLQ